MMEQLLVLDVGKDGICALNAERPMAPPAQTVEVDVAHLGRMLMVVITA